MALIHKKITLSNFEREANSKDNGMGLLIHLPLSIMHRVVMKNIQNYRNPKDIATPIITKSEHEIIHQRGSRKNEIKTCSCVPDKQERVREMEKHIIPYPNALWRGTEERWQLQNPCMVWYGDFEPYCTDAYAVRSGIALQPGGESAVLRLVRDKSYAPEEYRITVANDVEIIAAKERGVIWALATFFLGTENGSHTCGTLQDAPKYVHRGFHLDCARHFFNAETVESIIDVASLSKMNVMHWHLTDDQGWRIESAQYPLLTQEGAFYTKEEICRVVTYAKTRGIDIIPEIDLPGHTSAVLAAYPQLGCFSKKVSLRKGGGIYPIILCAGKDETLTFIKNILTETAALFPGEFVHLGGDEAPKSEWAQCPHCAARMETMGITGLEDLQGWLIGQAMAHLNTLGKRAICWNCCLAADNLPGGVLVQQWMDIARESRTLPFWQAGGEVVFSDGPYCYFDYPVAITNLKKVYSYIPKIKKTDCSNAKNTRGIECCLWTEGIETPEHIGTMLFPRLFATAEIGWSNTRDYAQFERNLPVMLAYLDERSISYTPLSNANPTGRSRREQVEQFFTDSSGMKNASEGSVEIDKSSVLRLLFMVFGLKDIPMILRILIKKKQ